MSSPTAQTEVLSVAPSVSNDSLANRDINNTNNTQSPQRNRGLTPVVVCGSACTIPSSRDNQLLSPLVITAAAKNARSTPVGNELLPNNVPTSESEKLTAMNTHVLKEMGKARPKPADVESTACPESMQIFRRAWWAGVRPTTCERTCRHRSKVCDAVQLCNDCTGYYCKWLADLVGIPVLKASGRVDPLLFERDPLAKLYWKRISKVTCCPNTIMKCLMCVRRYQLFTHFLPGNLDFRRLVYESVMKLHEEGFSVDMGLIRKVSRRLLECIADSMELILPIEYMPSCHVYDAIMKRRSLVDAAVVPTSIHSLSHFNSSDALSPSSGAYAPLGTPPSQKTTHSPSSAISAIDTLDQSGQEEMVLGISTSDSGLSQSYVNFEIVSPMVQHKDFHRNTSEGASNDTVMTDERHITNQRPKRRIKRPFNRDEGIYYEDDEDELSLGHDRELKSDESDTDERLRKKRRRKQRRSLSTALSNLRFENQFTNDLDKEIWSGNSALNSLIHQFQGLPNPLPTNETPTDTETDQMICRTKQESWNPSSMQEGICVPNSAVNSSKMLGNNNSKTASIKFSENTKFEGGVSSHGGIDCLTAAFLQRFENHQSRSTRHESMASESMHRKQLEEELRLSKCGVQGVFWDPTKEGWCVLLPLLPSTVEDHGGLPKRKILCFAANTWNTIESAKWSAVYERLRRNPLELESLSQIVRTDLSNWVRDHIEVSNPLSSEEEQSEASLMQQSIKNSDKLDFDLSQFNTDLLTAEFSSNNSSSFSKRLTNLFAEHALEDGKSGLQPETTTSTVQGDDGDTTTEDQDSNLNIGATISNFHLQY